MPVVAQLDNGVNDGCVLRLYTKTSDKRPIDFQRIERAHNGCDLFGERGLSATAKPRRMDLMPPR